MDILQVQQLLLDSTSSTAPQPQPPTTTNESNNTAANALNAARHRPRVNIQRASEYSSSLVNASCASTLLQGKQHRIAVEHVPGGNVQLCIIKNRVHGLIACWRSNVEPNVKNTRNNNLTVYSVTKMMGKCLYDKVMNDHNLLWPFHPNFLLVY